MKKRFILLTVVIVLLIVDYVILKNASLGNGKGLDGQSYSPDEVLKKATSTLFLGLPFISIILGNIISLFTFKQKKYTERVIQTSLVALVVFYTIFLVIGIRNLILW